MKKLFLVTCFWTGLAAYAFCQAGQKFVITEYGAKPDDGINTTAIQNAINAAAVAASGTVVIF